MLKFFFAISIFFVINISDIVAQDFNEYYNNYRNSKNKDQENNFDYKDSATTKNNYKDNSEDYQSKNIESLPNKNVIPSSSNEFNEKAEFNKPNNDFSNKLNSITPSTNIKKNTNFKDGKGLGYRVYDNSNRQSYFCNLAPERKKIFTHDNNFNGIYVGLGIAKIDSAVNFSQNSIDRTFGAPIKTVAPYKFDYSGSKSLPSIVIGQGRLFSSGLFLGQEFAMNIGEFNINSNKINNNEYKKITYSFSNYSYYSGKFGFNIFKIFLPYVKLSLSTSSSRFILQKSDDSKVISGGSLPSVGVGAGIDISIQDHIRAIIDYTQFSGSGSGYLSSSKAGASNVVNNIAFDSTYSFTRASLVYRF